MKEPLQCSEEIKGELPFFMPAHLLAVGSLILGHKENGVFTSAHLHTDTHTPPTGHKVAFTVGVLILCGWWGTVGVHTPTLNVPSAVKFNCCFLGSAFCSGGGRRCFMTDRPTGRSTALSSPLYLCKDAGQWHWFTLVTPKHQNISGKVCKLIRGKLVIRN